MPDTRHSTLIASIFQFALVASCYLACERAPDGSRQGPTPPAPGPETEASPPSTAELERFEWNENLAVQLVALPLSCIDRPHRPSRRGNYLYETVRSLRPNYEGSLAFYGCSDWHSAVNSIWAMVKALKEFPDIPIGKLIREKLENHLSEESLRGEIAFFEEQAPPGFERLYGWAWLVRLYLELRSWDDDQGQDWAENLSPLAELLAERTLVYLDHLSAPIRVGTHDNTAFSLLFLLDYAEAVGNEKLTAAIQARSDDFFSQDRDCPLRYEPSGSDFLSPCLAEAVLMSRRLEASSFATWLDGFLPAPESPSFAPLRRPVEIREHYLPTEDVPIAAERMEPEAPDETRSLEPPDREGSEEDVLEPEPEPGPDPEAPPGADEETRLVGSRSHLIGLSFVRAAALRRLAAALPEDDPRRSAYLELARLHGQDGFEKMYDASYLGTHWLASFAIDMLTA